MLVRRLCALHVFALAAFAFAAPALAGQSVAFPRFDLTQDIEGVAVVLPLRLTVSAETPQSRVAIAAEIGLADLLAKADAIIAKAASRAIGRIDGLAYKGTQAGIEGENLRLKVHFNYDAGILDTNGSVTLRLALKEDGPALRLVPSSRPELKISNDIARLAAGLAGLDDDLEKAAAGALDKAFADPRAVLALPAALSATGLALESARFGKTSSDAPAAFMAASLPPAQP